VRVTRQLEWRGVFRITSGAALLFLGERLDRHAAPLRRGEVFEKKER
jgi:hypothetical protein